MRHIFVFILIVFSIIICEENNLLGQSLHSDASNLKTISLEVLLSEAPHKLNELAKKHLFSEPDKAVVYAEAALKVAVERNDKEEEAKGWYNLGNARKM